MMDGTDSFRIDAPPAGAEARIPIDPSGRLPR